MSCRKLRKFFLRHPCTGRAKPIASPLQRARSATRSKPRPSGSTKRGQPRGGRPVGRGGRKRHRLADLFERPRKGPSVFSHRSASLRFPARKTEGRAWVGRARHVGRGDGARSQPAFKQRLAVARLPVTCDALDDCNQAKAWLLVLCSYSATVPAIATFSDSASPDCGIDACTSQRASTSAGSPSRSAPRTKTTSPSSSSSGSGVPPRGTSATRRPGRLVERRERHAEERAHRRAQRLRAGRVGAAVRQATPAPNAAAERSSVADVPRVGDVPERERHRPHAARQVGTAEHAEHARRVRERRHLGEQRRLDVLAGDEQVDRLDAAGGLDEILTLRDEQLELVAPAPVMELADELEPLVVAGGDQT